MTRASAFVYVFVLAAAVKACGGRTKRAGIPCDPGTVEVDGVCLPVDSDAGADADSDIDGEADSDSDSDTETETDTGTVTDSETDTATQTDTDTEVPDDVAVACDRYCDHVETCGYDIERDVCERFCRCELEDALRRDAGIPYYACLSEADCEARNPYRACAAVVVETLEPSERAAEWLDACAARRDASCPELVCEYVVLYADAVIETFLPCFAEEVCDDVAACLTEAFGDAC